MNKVTEQAVKVWRDYRKIRLGDKVTRNGFYRMHSCFTVDELIIELESKFPGLDDRQKSTIISMLRRIDGAGVHRIESVSEHTRGAMALAQSISRFMPEVIPPAELPRYLELLQYHDLAENETGDIVDNGERDSNEKEKQEYNYMLKATEDWPAVNRNRLLRDYRIFLRPTDDSWSLVDRTFGENAKLCDKLDAVLRAIIYEANQASGEFTPHQELSSQDQRFVTLTRSRNTVDTWGAHFINLARNFIFYDHFLAILKVSVRELRGHWFEWDNGFSKAIHPKEPGQNSVLTLSPVLDVATPRTPLPLAILD